MSLRDCIPPHTLGQLDEYQHRRVPPGSFVHAVLTNDLYAALRKADEANLLRLRHIVRYVYCHMPVECRGSQDAVERWLNPPPPPLNEPSIMDRLEAGDLFVFADEPRDEPYQARGSCWYNTPGKQVGGPWHEEDRTRAVLIHQRAKR